MISFIVNCTSAFHIQPPTGRIGEASRVIQFLGSMFGRAQNQLREHNVTALTEAREDINWMGPGASQSNGL